MSLSLRSYLDSILSERDVTRQYAMTLCRRLDAFCDYLGRDALLTDLKSDALNLWVTQLQDASGWSPKTIRHYQSAVVLVWKEAFERGDVERPPWRIKRIKVPRTVVRAWTQEELRSILAAVNWLRGDVPGTDIWKRDWFKAYIPAAYSTGIRRCDLMNHALREDLRGDILTVQERKTGKIISRRLSKRAMIALGRIEHDKYLLPWDGPIRSFYASFKVLVQHAGVTPGGPHKIRKSAGSYAQRANGNGMELLGHVHVDTFDWHYHDRAISQRVPEPPPEL